MRSESMSASRSLTISLTRRPVEYAMRKSTRCLRKRVQDSKRAISSRLKPCGSFFGVRASGMSKGELRPTEGSVIEEAKCSGLHVAGANRAFLVLVEIKEIGLDVGVRDSVRGPSIVLSQLQDGV